MPKLPQAHATTTTKLPSTVMVQETAKILILFTYFDEDSCTDAVCMLLQIEKDQLESLNNSKKTYRGLTKTSIRMGILSSK